MRVATLIQNSVGAQQLDFGQRIKVHRLWFTSQTSVWFEVDFDGASAFNANVDLNRIESFINTGQAAQLELGIECQTIDVNLTFGTGRLFLTVLYDFVDA